jgi:hypothetical protein
MLAPLPPLMASSLPVISQPVISKPAALAGSGGSQPVISKPAALAGSAAPGGGEVPTLAVGGIDLIASNGNHDDARRTDAKAHSAVLRCGKCGGCYRPSQRGWSGCMVQAGDPLLRAEANIGDPLHEKCYRMIQRARTTTIPLPRATTADIHPCDEKCPNPIPLPDEIRAKSDCDDENAVHQAGEIEKYPNLIPRPDEIRAKSDCGDENPIRQAGESEKYPNRIPQHDDIRAKSDCGDENPVHQAGGIRRVRMSDFVAELVQNMRDWSSSSSGSNPPLVSHSPTHANRQANSTQRKAVSRRKKGVKTSSSINSNLLKTDTERVCSICSKPTVDSKTADVKTGSAYATVCTEVCTKKGVSKGMLSESDGESGKLICDRHDCDQFAHADCLKVEKSAFVTQAAPAAASSGATAASAAAAGGVGAGGGGAFTSANADSASVIWYCPRCVARHGSPPKFIDWDAEKREMFALGEIKRFLGPINVTDPQLSWLRTAQLPCARAIPGLRVKARHDAIALMNQSPGSRFNSRL